MEPIHGELLITRVACRDTKQAVIESEIAIPPQHDAARILSVQGDIKNTISRAMDGYVDAEGTIEVDALLMDRNEMPFGLHASTQYNYKIPQENSREGMKATVTPQILDLRYTLKNGRIAIDAVIEMDIMVTEEMKMPALQDIAGVEDLQKQYMEQEVGQWIRVGEKLEKLHESIPAPGVEQVLLADARAQVKSIDLTADGIDITGTLFVSALYTDESGQFTHLNQQVPLSATIDLDVDPRECAQVVVMPQVNNIVAVPGEEPGMLELDVELFREVFCIGIDQVRAISDLYAPTGELSARQEMIEQLSVVGVASRTCVFNEALRIPDDMPEAFRTVFAAARPSMQRGVDDNGKLAIEGIFLTNVVYQTDTGEIQGFEEDVPFSCTLDTAFIPDAQVYTNMLEVRASGSGRTLNVVYIMEASAILREMRPISIAVDVESTEPNVRDNGILVSYTGDGQGLWEIGKMHGVTQEQLREWNPGIGEDVGEGQPVLILSARGRKR